MDRTSRMSGIETILSRLLRTKAARYAAPQVNDFLLELQTIRWYAFASSVELSRLWETIREDVWVTDFVVDLTTDFQVHLAIDTDVSFEELAKIIGEAIDSMKYRDAKHLVVDDDFKARTPAEGITPYFQDNPWLIVCYLLTKIDISPAWQIIKQATPKKEIANESGG